MKEYQFQVLRFIPDQVSGEFINVAVAIYAKEEVFLRSISISKSARIKTFFPDVKARKVLKRIKFIRDFINKKGGELSDEFKFNEYENITELTNEILPKDDSSFIWSNLYVGIDINVDDALRDIFDRYISKHQSKNYQRYMSDKEVWKNYYKEYFDNSDYNNNITSRSIKTDGNTVDFDFAIKNGKWNYLEPVSFDLTRPATVKEKVYKWMGKLKELDSSDEEFNLFLLSKMPSNNNLKEFIKDRINENDADNFKVKIIEPSEAKDFAEKLRKDINHI